MKPADERETIRTTHNLNGKTNVMSYSIRHTTDGKMGQSPRENRLVKECGQRECDKEGKGRESGGAAGASVVVGTRGEKTAARDPRVCVALTRLEPLHHADVRRDIT